MQRSRHAKRLTTKNSFARAFGNAATKTKPAFAG
jgi:hypothetical protein